MVKGGADEIEAPQKGPQHRPGSLRGGQGHGEPEGQMDQGREEEMAELRGEWATRRVWLDGKELKPAKSQKVWNHSPDGFNWGYGGSGPAQLALAVLLEYIPQDDAVKYHQDFKRNVIAQLPQSDFKINFDHIDNIHEPLTRIQSA